MPIAVFFLRKNCPFVKSTNFNDLKILFLLNFSKLNPDFLKNLVVVRHFWRF